MSEQILSSDVRQRLWQCYSLLLSLADEDDTDDTIESEIEDGCKKITENNGGGVGDYFWFTTLDKVLAPDTNFFSDQIWQVAGRDGEYRLS